MDRRLHKLEKSRRFVDLRRCRSFDDGTRRKLGEVEGVVLELGTAEVCNSEDCQKGSANAAPARSADLIAPTGIQLTGLGGAKQKRSVSVAICRIRRGEAELPKAVATAVPSEFLPRGAVSESKRTFPLPVDNRQSLQGVNAREPCAYFWKRRLNLNSAVGSCQHADI